jgi:rhodanese-related sulfurtransferase
VGQALYFRERVSWQSRVAESDMVTLELARSWGAAAIWIDARPDADFERDHVPGAILLNEDRWNELLPQFLAVWSPGKKVVVYCSAQSCDLAREVAERLRKEAQLPDVFVLDGGWEAWVKKNR